MENAPVAKANMKIYKTKNKFLRAKSVCEQPFCNQSGNSGGNSWGGEKKTLNLVQN